MPVQSHPAMIDATMEIRAHHPSVVASCLNEVHAAYRSDDSGVLADYIPELTRADPRHFGIALVTADGESYAVGDSRAPFTIQSISKAFVYGLALEDHGLDGVLERVGVEPSGDAFNAIVFDEKTNRPFNPMVNAGAIATTGLIKGNGVTERMERVVEMFRRYTGRTLTVDETVFASESATGHRNRAITWLMLNFGMVDARVDEHLEVYFRQCSLLVTAEDLAMMAATLANGGVNPRTGERALECRYVKHVTAVMASCGMYDYAGEWSFRVGLPAKSGVGGGIVAVLPGQLGIGTFSPLLDARGNSSRGIRACEELSRRFGLHVFAANRSASATVARSYRGDKVHSKVVRRAEERTLLETHGRAIAVLEIQGDLQFGQTEQVLRQVTAGAGHDDPRSHLILDMQRVTRISTQAADLLASLDGNLTAAGTRLYVSAPGENLPVLVAAGLRPACLHETLDHALEHCEAVLLAQLAGAQGMAPEAVPFAQMELLAGLDPQAIELLAAQVSLERHAPGTAIIRSGDEASTLFFLSSGRVAILIDGAGSHRIRVTTISPGVAFGEMALLDGRPRSADAIAEDHCVVFRLGLDAFKDLNTRHPDVGLAIMANIARILSARLRGANTALQALAR